MLEQLSGLDGLLVRAMFGGHGLSLDGVFFAILWRGRLYFRTTESSRKKYISAGMEPFRPSARQTLASYREVPLPVLEDPRELVRWAREAAAGTRVRAGRHGAPQRG